MTNDSLYKRLRRFGTLTESPNDIPDAVFALPSTIHWIRALAILVDDRAVAFQSARIFYGKVQKREMDDRTLNTVRSEEHTSELQSLMRISYAVFCLKKKKHTHNQRK